MKRYLVFYGELYYPNGGMRDFIGDFDNLTDAIVHLNTHHNEYSEGHDVQIWGNVYDSIDRKLVYII